MRIDKDQLGMLAMGYGSKLGMMKDKIGALSEAAKPISDSAADAMDKLQNPLTKLAGLTGWASGEATQVSPAELAGRLADVVEWVRNNPDRIVEVLAGLGAPDTENLKGFLMMVGSKIPPRDVIAAEALEALTELAKDAALSSMIQGNTSKIEASYAEGRAKLVEYIGKMGPQQTMESYLPFGIKLTQAQAEKLAPTAKGEMEQMLVVVDAIVKNIVSGKQGDIITGINGLVSDIGAMVKAVAELSDLARADRALAKAS